jgi:protein-disulfide isomerase
MSEKASPMQKLATAVLVLCAVIITGLLVRRELAPAVASPPRAVPVKVADWREYAAGGTRMGPAAAPVTIVVFSDFQCPACKVLADRLSTVRAERANDFAVVHRHHPLASHPHARPAAQASECAARQGRFEAMHDALFKAQASIGERPWNDFAKEAGVRDIGGFSQCMRDGATDSVLARDAALASRLGVEATPTLLINDTRLVGALPIEALNRHITEAMRAPARR